MPDYPITPGTITDPFCPTSWQQTLEEFAARMTVTLPAINGFIAQESTPAVADQDKVWIKTSAAPPYVLGAYVYQGGAWRLVPAPVTATYFVDTGVANTWVITTGEAIPDNSAYVTGRLWVVRVNNNVTGATTLQIDSLSAKGVKKQDDEDLAAGEVVAGQLVLLSYDATAGAFEILTTLSERTTQGAASLAYTVATSSAAQTIPNTTETVVEWNSETDPSGIVTLDVATDRFTLLTGSYVIDVSVPVLVSGGSAFFVLILYDVTGAVIVSTNTYGVDSDDESAWLHIKRAVTVSGTSNAYDVRIYRSSAGTVALGSPAGLGAYNETYQQISIVKVT